MSEFVYLFRSSESQQREFMGNPERAQQSMQVWLAWMRGLEEKGHLKNPGQPLGHTGKVVRGKEKAVTDGPYIEAKEYLGSFDIIDVDNLERALEIAARVPFARVGQVEVRPLMHEAPDNE